MKKNFCKVRRGHCLSLVWIVSFLLWGNVTMAALPIQEAKLSIQQRSVALSRVFYEIEKQTGYSFLVRNNDINMNEKVSIDVKNKSVEEVLEMLFVGKNIRYKVEGEHISVYKPQQSRQNAITGLVMDVAKEPVIGASVVVMGSTNGCITDFDGKFSLEVSEFPVKLQISYIGYKSQEVTVRDTKTIQVVLREDTETLDEVVVVGYGSQKKANLTGAVASVKMDEVIGNRPLSQAADALQGTVPGLFVSSDGNAPGKSKSFQIRGAYSVGIKNDDGSYGSAIKPLILIDNVEGDLDMVNPEDIETVTVLKDAASAAIYGARAAGGVILVTTKRGEASNGKFDITFSANYGWQQFLYVPQTASAADHMLLINEKYYNAFGDNTYPNRTPAKYTWEQMMEYSTGKKKSTNWTKELFDDNVPQQQYNISVNGGSEKVNYFFNLGYLKQEGSYKSGSLNYDRWNFRSNIDAKITNRLKASVQASGYMDEKNQPFTDIWSVYKKAWTYRPTSEAYVDGDHNYPAWDSEMGEPENPVAAINSDLTGYRREKRVNFNGSLTLTYDIPGVKGLNAKAFYSYDYSSTNNTQYKRPYKLYNRREDGTLESFERNPDSNLRRSTDPGYATTMQLSLNYARKFGDHNVSAMVLFEEQYNNWDSFYAQRVMQLVGEYLIYGEEEGQIGSMGGAGDVTRQAYVGKLTYDYKGRYMVDFSFREDGSSRYPKDGRWGFFPGVSAGWRISEEPFVKELVPFLTNLKLRGSWGKMGDDGAAGTYPETAVAYNINKDRIAWFYNGILMTGVEPTAIPNPDKTWYTSKTVNLGLDFDLWNQKLSGTVEFFKRKREGLLATASTVVPGTVGANLPQENLNADQTFGWEISLNHRNRVGDVNYWVGGQISATKNRWDYRLDSQASNSMDAWRRRDVSGRNKDIWFSYEEGGRFSSYEQIRYHDLTGGGYGQGTLPGDYYYKDWNGDGIINGEDNHPMASYNLPVFNYGFVMGADWKGIDVSMNWQGAAGVYNSYDEVFTEVGPFNGGAVLDIYLDRWHTVNPSDDPFNPNTKWVSGLYPATGHSFSNAGTGIKNTSYLRLKTLEVGYTLPKTWIAKAGIQNLRIYFNAYNLLTFTGLDNIDPERPGRQGGANNNADSGILFYNYPVNRTFNIGATIKF